MKSCPRCQKGMARRAVASIEVEECPVCRGLWFEDHELRLAKDRSDGDLAWLDFEIWKHPERFQVAARPLPCPRGDDRMVSVRYGATDVTVDYCPACRGVWLDTGEFAKIIAELKAELSSKSAREYLDASLSEASELLAGPESFVSEWRDLTAVLRLLQLRFFVEHPALIVLINSLPRA